MRTENQAMMKAQKMPVAPKRAGPLPMVQPLNRPASGSLSREITPSTMPICGMQMNRAMTAMSTALIGLMSISSSSERMRAYSNAVAMRKYTAMQPMVALLASM